MTSAYRLSGVSEPLSASCTTQRGEISVCAAFREVAEALAEGRDADVVLHLIAEKLCQLTGTFRCSIHLVDKETGLVRGQVAHAPTNIDAQVRRLVSGGPGDNFTREILATRRPVALMDTLTDPRPIRSAMRRWNVRSVLGIPMIFRDEVIGVMYLDNGHVPREFSPAEQELVATFADLAATAIKQAELTTRLRSSLATVSRQIEQLRQSIRLEEQLTEIILRGSTLREIGDTVARLLTRPCAIYDAAFRRLVLSLPDGPARDFVPRLLDKDIRSFPAVTEILARLKPGTPEIIEPLPWLGLHHRLLVSAVMLNDECWGYVVVAEHGRRLSSLDKAVVRRAALNIALERSGERRAGEIEWHTIEAFTGSLLRGEESAAALEKRAEVLGLRLDVPRVVCLVAARRPAEGLELSPQSLAKMLTGRGSPSAVMAAPSGDDIALILELPDGSSPRRGVSWAKDRLCEVLAEIAYGGGLYAAISSVVRAPGDDTRAYAEARQVLSCMRNHLAVPGDQVLTVDDLGAGRLLLASVDSSEALRFAQDALGPLLVPNDAKVRELLVTLSVFLSAGRSVRRSARLLGVHTNTIRYRMTRIEKLTGLAVATDSDAQLTAQLALLVLRLNGQLPPMPTAAAFDESELTIGDAETEEDVDSGFEC